jgi:hypothetical protein
VSASRRAAVTLVAGLSLIAAGCGSDGSKATGGTSTSTSTAPTSTSTTLADTIGRPTQWRDETARWKQLAPTPFSEGPTAVADDLAAIYRGGDTSEVGEVKVLEVRTGEPLVVVLRETGVSDGIPGRDIEITLEGSDAGWAVTGARVRDYCMQVDESQPTQCG